MAESRQLRDLVSVGPKVEADLHRLGIRSVNQLAAWEPKRLYARLCRLTGQRQDPCVLDVFSAAVAQARDPFLPYSQCQWWYWSRQRQRAKGKGQKAKNTNARLPREKSDAAAS